MKSVTSTLSLESELDIEVSAQYKALVLLLPRTTILLPVVILPLGLLALPESCPMQILLSPVVI